MKRLVLKVSFFVIMQSCTIITFGQLKYLLKTSETKNSTTKTSFLFSPKPTLNFIGNKNPAVAKLAPNYYTQQLRFICKAEYQMQKSIKIPLYFRLGSLNYTNYMEGKNKSYLLK
jgi:hypothetical protein